MAISDLDQSSEVRNLILAEVVGRSERSDSTFFEVLRTLVIICPFGQRLFYYSWYDYYNSGNKIRQEKSDSDYVKYAAIVNIIVPLLRRHLCLGE